MSKRLLPSPQVFISAKQLEPVINNVVFFDVRGKNGLANHEKSRPAPPCIHVDYDSPIVRDVSWMEKTGARHHLPPIEKFIAWAESQGLGRKPAVCFDDQCGGSNAARLWWMLDAIGVESYILDGGIFAYQKEGLPIASGSNTRTAVDEPFAPGTAPYAKTQEWKNVIEAEDIPKAKRILDARNIERYSSLARAAGTDGQAGHITNSDPYPYMSNMTGPQGHPETRMKSNEELMQLWKNMANGVEPQDVCHSCGSGVTACYNYAIQRHLGLPEPKLYIGSWSEWCTLNRDVVVKDQIAKQGYSIVFTKNNIEGPSVDGENEKTAITIDETKFDDFAAVLKEFESKDANLIKALRVLKQKETVKVYTSVKTYDVQC